MNRPMSEPALLESPRRPVLALRTLALMLSALLLVQCAETNLPFTERSTPAQQTAEVPPKVEQPAPAPTPVPEQMQPAPRAEVTVQQAPVLVPPLGATAEPVRVGLLLPLSGAPEAQRIGQAMLDTATLALFDLGGKRLQLLPRDTGGTAEGAQTAAAALLEEGVQLLLGPVFSTSVEAAAPLARARGVPMIAFSSNNRVAGDGVYLLSFTPQQEVDRVVDYVFSKGARRFAAIVPEDQYGQAVLQALRDSVLMRNGELAGVEFVTADGTDAHEPVKRLARYAERHQDLLDRRRELAAMDTAASRRRLAALKNRDTLGSVDFDAVMLAAGGETLRQVAPLLPYYDIDVGGVHLLGTGRWDAPDIGREPAMIGGLFAGAERTAIETFGRRFEALFGRPPLRLASLAYDAAALAALLSQGDGEPDFSAANLTDPAGFAGVDGVFRFRPDGRAERGLAVLQIERDALTVVSPAPTGFVGALTN